jgi:hypothetical protein
MSKGVKYELLALSSCGNFKEALSIDLRFAGKRSSQ